MVRAVPAARAPGRATGPPATVRPSGASRSKTLAVLAAGFLAVHVALDLYLGLAPGSLSRLPGTQLLEISFLWLPVLFVAALFGFATGARFNLWFRFGLLFGYAGLMLGAVPLWAQGAEWARELFYLLFRFAPVPAFLFLFGHGRYRWSLSRCIGLALIFGLVWRAVYFSFDDLLVIAEGGATLPAAPVNRLYITFFLSTLWDVAYPILGLMFFLHRVPGLHVRPQWGNQLERLLAPFGAWIRRSLPVDVAWGAVFFVVNLFAAILLVYVLAQSPTGDVGDDSAVFSLITLDQVFLISIVAGVGEELVYRGLLQSGLQRLFGRGAAGTALAILVQSLPFAVVHAGYADLDHLITPWVFALFMGVVFRFFGLVPAIIVHVEIDVYAFGFSYAGIRNLPGGGVEAQNPGMLAFLSLLVIANLAAGVVFLVLELLKWWEGRRRALATLARA